MLGVPPFVVSGNHMITDYTDIYCQIFISFCLPLLPFTFYASRFTECLTYFLQASDEKLIRSFINTLFSFDGYQGHPTSEALLCSLIENQVQSGKWALFNQVNEAGLIVNNLVITLEASLSIT